MDTKWQIRDENGTQFEGSESFIKDKWNILVKHIDNPNEINDPCEIDIVGDIELIEFHDFILAKENEICIECEGKGSFPVSSCCSADITDSGICMECHDHCDPDECDYCKGTGKSKIL
jgi:hypothetical protein